MEAEDKEFFILVLGVLAAILVVISWWFTAGSTGFGATATKPTTGTAVDNGDNDNDNDDADASHGDHHEPDQDHGADADHADPDSDAPVKLVSQRRHNHRQTDGGHSLRCHRRPP